MVRFTKMVPMIRGNATLGYIHQENQTINPLTVATIRTVRTLARKAKVYELTERSGKLHLINALDTSNTTLCKALGINH